MQAETSVATLPGLESAAAYTLPPMDLNDEIIPAALLHPPEGLTAARTTTVPQLLALWMSLAVLLICGVCWGFPAVASALNEIILIFYAVVVIHRVLILLAGLLSLPRLSPGAIASPPALLPAKTLHAAAGSSWQEAGLARSGVGLPFISVLIPLYREVAVLDQIVAALGRMDYPAGQFEVLLLLEEDDGETRAACEAATLPANTRAIVVPAGTPRTKPRACNHGLRFCRGEITVVFDAEDQPEPDQFRKAVEALARSGPRVACVQARLAYYNPRQNLLTRWFAAEYLTWFEIMLPGMHAIASPIPLGGTSNHFRTAVLREVGGWDPWNVAEDCDLGMRLSRFGYRVDMFDSTTWEEACPGFSLWIRQRSRWIKGYLQTWLVHNRKPLQLLRQLGPWGFLNFQLTVGGSALCLILNPIYWALTALWWLHPTALEAQVLGGPALLLGNLCWIGGNLVLLLAHSLGALRRRHWDLALLGFFVPFYWMMMSIAAWKALKQLIFSPHYWEKTRHGLAHQSNVGTLPNPDDR